MMIVVTGAAAGYDGGILPPSGPGQPSPIPSGPPPPEDEPMNAPDIHPGLAQSANSQLRLLGQYEARLGRGLNRMMVFAAMPADQAAAQEQAFALSSTLLEYQKQGIEPLIIFEPGTLDIRTMDSAVFSSYFKALKANGVTDKAIGTWAPFPEPNIPEWGDPAKNDKGNTDPELFKANFTMVIGAMRDVFPDAKAHILLDSATYPSYDHAYEHVSYEPQTLLRYVAGLEPGLVSELGLQGFPWEPANFDPVRFLNGDLAIAAAKELDVDLVSLNTGTFAVMGQTVVTPAKRQEILNNILHEAHKMQDAGLNVAMNIFAENKAETEADWSYSDPAADDVFMRFVRSAERNSIDLSIFDTTK